VALSVFFDQTGDLEVFISGIEIVLLVKAEQLQVVHNKPNRKRIMVSVEKAVVDLLEPMCENN
jgi:hypothetical protein